VVVVRNEWVKEWRLELQAAEMSGEKNGVAGSPKWLGERMDREWSCRQSEMSGEKTGVAGSPK